MKSRLCPNASDQTLADDIEMAPTPFARGYAYTMACPMRYEDVQSNLEPFE